MTLFWFLLIVAIWALWFAARDAEWKRPASWFDLQPYMRQSKSQTGHAQQKRRKR